MDDDDDGATRYHTSEGFTWEKEYERSWDLIKEDEKGLRVEADAKIRKRRYIIIYYSSFSSTYSAPFLSLFLFQLFTISLLQSKLAFTYFLDDNKKQMHCQ
jgi:hypothetical protein